MVAVLYTAPFRDFGANRQSKRRQTTYFDRVAMRKSAYMKRKGQQRCLSALICSLLTLLAHRDKRENTPKVPVIAISPGVLAHFRHNNTKSTMAQIGHHIILLDCVACAWGCQNNHKNQADPVYFKCFLRTYLYYIIAQTVFETGNGTRFSFYNYMQFSASEVFYLVGGRTNEADLWTWFNSNESITYLNGGLYWGVGEPKLTRACTTISSETAMLHAASCDTTNKYICAANQSN